MTANATGAGAKIGNNGDGERLARGLLMLALLAAAALLLWLNRGTSFWNDELTWFGNLSGLHGLDAVLAPHNSHLIGTTRLVYLLTAETVGPDYLVMRILGVASVLLAATLFYVWAKRRIGPGWALLPAVLLMFYGSAWQHVVGPVGFTVTFSIALGLGALIAAESEGRRSDLLACGLLILAVFTYTVGLAYLVGVAISVLLRGDRLRRAWIFLVPLLLYAAWWVWAQQFDQGRTEFVGLVSIVKFFARSMAVNASGITGVDIPLLRIFGSNPALDASPTLAGWLAGLALTAALIWRVLRGNVPRSFWVSLGVLVTFWLAAAIADTRAEGTQVYAIRYLFPGSSALLLVLTDAVSGFRIRAGWAYALLAVFAFSLAMNLVYLRDGAAYLRGQGAENRLELAILELRQGFEPGSDAASPSRAAGGAVLRPGTPVPTGFTPEYFDSVARFGSPAMSIAGVKAQPAASRAAADELLLASGGVAILPFDEHPPSREICRHREAGRTFSLKPGFWPLMPTRNAPVDVFVDRFSNPPGQRLGSLEPKRWSLIAISPDRYPVPWRITLDGAVRNCPVLRP
ncbi:MAG: hypothetical protein R2718_12440 [Solirubrobacterales bacterium]